MENPLVTIAIPTYNRAASYLPQVLKAALNQTYSNLEIIVSDNCSSDNTPGLVSAITDPRLRYIRHEVNIGGNNNFNFCIQQAKGEFFLLLHDDDLIDEDFIETCIRAANGIPDVGMVRTGMRWIDLNGNVRGSALNRVGGLPVEEFYLGWFHGKTPMHLCSTLFHTQRLREIGEFRSKHNRFEDVLTEAKLAAKHNRVDVPEVKASFRHHPEQQAGTGYVDTWCEDSLLLLDTMCALVPASKSDSFRREATKFFIRANYRRARALKSLYWRLNGYATVLKYFNYPIARFTAIAFSLAFSRFVNATKKFIKKQLERAPALRVRVETLRKDMSGVQH